MCSVPKETSEPQAISLSILRQFLVRSSYCFDVHVAERERDIQILIDQLSTIHAVRAALLNLHYLCMVGCKIRLENHWPSGSIVEGQAGKDLGGMELRDFSVSDP